jgi:hypothetical protein
MKKRLLLALVVLTGMLLLSASIVWAQSAPVVKTGQTTSYRTGDDGDLEKGVASPSPRFTDHGNGTVTDNLTGLMWAKDADLAGAKMIRNAAIDYANNLTLGSDGCGTSYTDWRLPNSNELSSLMDKGNFYPALPTGHPFINVRNWAYWTSTTCSFNTDLAWLVYMEDGGVSYHGKNDIIYAWPVRSDN